MAREVPLSRAVREARGLPPIYALVDNQDYGLVAGYKWSAVRTRHTVYARRALRLPDGRIGTTSMHQHLTGWPMTDHINGNGIDNRRSVNLRPATPTENNRNRRMRSDNSSGFKGVTRNKRERAAPWRVQISFDGRRREVGAYATAEEAARAYDAAALEQFGEFAWLNFPVKLTAS